MSFTFDYSVDLPAGDYTVREILNYCCISNPTKFFAVARNPGGQYFIEPINLYNANPLVPPRAAAVRFWEIEITKPTNGIPSASEISTAISDADPKKRWAARCYLEAAWQNYQFSDLVAKSDSPEKAVWAELEIQDVVFRGRNDSQFEHDQTPGFTNSLEKIKSPELALVALLEQTRERKETSYLDAIVSMHKFTQLEIASVKPDVYRLARESPLVLNKLRTLKIDVPALSPEALRELEDTNLFTLVPRK